MASEGAMWGLDAVQRLEQLHAILSDRPLVKEEEASLVELIECLHKNTVALPVNADSQGLPPVIHAGVQEIHKSMKAYSRTARTVVLELMQHLVESERVPIDDIVGDFLLVLVFHCVEQSEGSQTWIKQCFAKRELFTKLDYTLPSTHSFSNLLLLLAGQLYVMNLEEGRKFIAFIMRLATSLIDDIHKVLRRHIMQTDRASLVDACAEIYFMAWKGSSGSSRLYFEEMLQEFMEEALHCEDDKLFYTKRAPVLDAFHEANGAAEVAHLLHRLYGPLLMRGMDYTNDTCRRRAIYLVGRSFPLRDPDMPRSATSAAVEAQWEKLVAALRDACPANRAEAVGSVCAALRKHWDVLPLTDSIGTLRALLTETAHDRSDVNVRLRVLKGIDTLLVNTTVHEHLRPLLPRLRPCLDDVALCIRVAFVRLLRSVSQIRGIAYWNVAPLDAILHRLAYEVNGTLTGELISLVQPSLCPASGDRVCRAVGFIKLHPPAARKFFSRLRSYQPAKAVASLMADLADWCVACSRLKTERGGPPSKRRKTTASDAEPVMDVDPNNSDLTLPIRAWDDKKWVEAVFHVVGLLLKSLRAEVPKLPKKLQQDVIRRMAELPVSMRKAYNTSQPIKEQSRWMLAVLPSSTPQDEDKLMKQLQKCLTTGTVPGDMSYDLLLLAACSWGKLPQVMTMLVDTLTVSVESSTFDNSLPLKFLHLLMVEPLTEKSVLEHWKADPRTWTNVAALISTCVRVHLVKHLAACEGTAVTFFVFALQLYFRIAMVMATRHVVPSDVGEVSANGTVRELLLFIHDQLLPQIIPKEQTMPPPPPRGRGRRPKRARVEDLAKSTAGDLKNQVAESALLWVEKLVRCGLVDFKLETDDDSTPLHGLCVGIIGQCAAGGNTMVTPVLRRLLQSVLKNVNQKNAATLQEIALRLSPPAKPTDTPTDGVAKAGSGSDGIVKSDTVASHQMVVAPLVE